MEADAPPGPTRVARAASAQALASALDASAAVWVDVAGASAIVRVVPADDGEPRQAPFPEVSASERARVFAVVAASLLGELGSESGLPVTSLRVEIQAAPPVAAPVTAPSDTILPTPPPTYEPRAMPFEGPAEPPPVESVGVRPVGMATLALGAFLEVGREQFFGDLELGAALALGRYVMLSVVLGIGTYMDAGTTNVRPESEGFRPQFRPGVELGFATPFNDDVEVYFGPRTLFVGTERPSSGPGCCGVLVPAVWTWGLAFGGFLGLRWELEPGLRAATFARVEGQLTVNQAYGAEVVTTLGFRLELR